MCTELNVNPADPRAISKPELQKKHWVKIFSEESES